MSNPTKRSQSPAIFFVVLALHIGMGYALYQKIQEPVKIQKNAPSVESLQAEIKP